MKPIMKPTLKKLAILSAIFYILKVIAAFQGWQLGIKFAYAFIIFFTGFLLCLVLLLIDKYL